MSERMVSEQIGSIESGYGMLGFIDVVAKFSFRDASRGYKTNNCKDAGEKYVGGLPQKKAVPPTIAN